MKTSLRNVWKRISVSKALIRCLAVLLAYMVGAHVTGRFHAASSYMGAMLACTSAIVVMQSQGVRDSIQKGWLRVLGTFLGAFIACVYLEIFHFSMIGFTAILFTLELICMAIKIPDGGTVAAMTLIIILLISQESPTLSPLLNGTLRFVEAAVGVAIGVAVLWIIERLRALRHPKKSAQTAQKQE